MTQRPVRHHWFCLLAFGVMLLGASAVLADDGALARADALYEASRFKEAIPLYEQAVPTLEGEAKVEAQQRLAYSLLRAYKRDPDPIEAYKKLLQMPEADAERRANACYQIGYLHSLQGDYETALEWYYKVPEIDGASPDTVAVAWLFAGTAYRKLDDYDRALEVLHKATEVTEAHWVRRQTAWVNIGSQHQEFEQYDQAVEAFREAVKLGPNHHYAHVARNRILECEAAQSGSDAFYLDPYVTHISATTAHVCWVSRHDAPAGTVQVTPEDGETITVDTERTDFRDHKSAFRQRAQLTGLTPGTRYTYVVTCGDESEAGAFTTAPDDQRVVRFGVLGDTQGGHATHAEVAEDIATFDPHFVLHVGDCVERGQRWDEWKVQLFDPGRPYLAKGPIYPARGNHDGGPYFRTLFDRDADLFTDFRFGDVHVFVMDSQSSTGGARRTQQLEWLETGLASSDARWKIVTLHHPMVHSPATEPLFGVDDFLNIVTEQEADFVLTGHYHVYQRLLPIGLEDKKPVLHVTTGGGGGNMGSRTMSPLIVTDSMKHHHLRFTVDGDKLEMVALLNDGTEIDRYTLIKTADNQYQPEVMQRSVPLALAQHVRLFYHYLTQPNVRLDEYGAALIDADAAEPGARVTLRLNRHLLDAEKIPADAALLLRPIDGEPWTLDAQTLDILADEWTFTATAPDDLAIDEGGKVRPSLRMHVVLRVGEFEFEPEPVDVIVEADE